MSYINNILGALVVLAWGGPTVAEPVASPTVVELFTSQSCSSCPPAEALLGQLAARPDLIALEFHVDYWNDLTYGAAGRWADVHSSPAHTARQRAYAARIGDGVYTPQMVIDGQVDAVGSQGAEVTRALAAAQKGPRLALDVAATQTGGLSITVAAPRGVTSGPLGGPAQIWLARYLEEETTRVRGGENHGKVLVNHHIVTGMSRLADWSGDAVPIDVGPLDLHPGEGCAILIQGPGQGLVLGAATCPKAP